MWKFAQNNRQPRKNIVDFEKVLLNYMGFENKRHIGEECIFSREKVLPTAWECVLECRWAQNWFKLEIGSELDYHCVRLQYFERRSRQLFIFQSRICRNCENPKIHVLFCSLGRIFYRCARAKTFLRIEQLIHFATFYIFWTFLYHLNS